MCNKQMKAKESLALPELLAHSLRITAHKRTDVENGVRLLRQGHRVLGLVRGTREHLALSLQLGHGSQTHLARFEDGAGSVLDCVVLSTRYTVTPRSPLQHIHLVLHLSLQLSGSLVVNSDAETHSTAAHQFRTLHLHLHVGELSLLGLVLLPQRLHLLHNRRLQRGGKHARLDVALLKAVVGLLELLFAVLDEGN